MTSSLQFGTIDDSNAVLSTSPAAPSTMTDVKQVKSFGSIVAGNGEPSPASPAVARASAPQRTNSPAPASGKPKKKFDVNSLFQKPQENSPPAAGPASVSASTSAPAPAPALTPAPAPGSGSVPQQMTTPAATPTPLPTSQEGVRPPQKHQGSYDSPSMRNSPLPVVSHPSNQAPPLQPGPGSAPYHFPQTPSHLRQSTNGAPAFPPPRSPNLNRAMTNGSMRGPPGAPVTNALGSPRPSPSTATPNASAPPSAQTPISGVPPPGMMSVPGGPAPHPPHMQSPVPPLAPNQMHQMGIHPPMWGYYVNIY